MPKITLNDLSSTINETSSIALVNANNALIEAALENTLSRDGTTPNSMSASLDMNSNRILNLPAPIGPTEPLRLGDIDPDSIQSQVAAAEAAAIASEASADDAAASNTSAEGHADDAEAAASLALDYAGRLVGTSTSSLTIETGDKSFTTQANKFFTPGTWLVITSDAAPTVDYFTGNVSSYSGTSLVVTNISHFGSGLHNDWTIRVSGRIGLTGDTGATGDTGNDGANGADGLTVINGLDYTFDTTTVDADPGIGELRFNNTTISSVTNLYISKTGRNSEDLEDFIASWDDSTTTANRGTIVVTTVANPSEFFICYINSSLTDGTTYWKVPVTFVSGNGLASNGERISVRFFRTGDTGVSGAGTGDVVGPASATDNGFVKYDGTTGKLVKDSAATIAGSEIALTGTTATTAVEATDEVLIYDSSATANRKATLANVFKSITGLTAETAPAVGDELPLYDVSASTGDKITLANLLKVINGLTAETAIVPSSDYLLVYDTSASDVRRCLAQYTTTVVTQQVFTSSGTWNRPTGCRKIKVTVVGGGGGGGGCTGASNQAGLGGGGGSGSAVIGWIDVTAVSSVAVTIGAGGASGDTTPSNGGTGGTSSFGAYNSAAGGSGGLLMTAGTSFITGAGGAGGTATGGDVNCNGNAGGRSLRINGTDFLASGSGSPSIFGGAGRQVVNSAGENGANGGGGAGGATGGTTARAGGVGGDGIVIVEEFY